MCKKVFPAGYVLLFSQQRRTRKSGMSGFEMKAYSRYATNDVLESSRSLQRECACTPCFHLKTALIYLLLYNIINRLAAN